MLLIISDDLRAEVDAAGFACASCKTPSLRRLSEGAGAVSFNRAYVQEALCAPTRNSFLTGRRPDSTLAYNFIDHFSYSSCVCRGFWLNGFRCWSRWFWI